MFKKHALAEAGGALSKAAGTLTRGAYHVRERERREERQVCEPEGRQRADLPARSRYGEGRERH